MTKKQKIYKNYLLKRVHTSKLYKEIYVHDRECYEQMLKNLFGVTSSKLLSIDELKKLVAYLEEGKEPKNTPTSNQINYIKLLWEKKAIWKDMASLLKFVKRVTKKDVNKLSEITKKEATYVISALNKLQTQKSANNPEYKGEI